MALNPCRATQARLRACQTLTKAVYDSRQLDGQRFAFYGESAEHGTGYVVVNVNLNEVVARFSPFAFQSYQRL
jgi:hypothetical protein